MRNCVALLVLSILAGCTASTQPGAVGVNRTQMMLLPAEQVESNAAAQYLAMAQSAKEQGRLVLAGPEYERIKAIAIRIKNEVGVFRSDTDKWRWQIALIDSPKLNAACAPGGKVIFYTGLVRQLKLSDDEIAIVLGHEVAHSLRNHVQEQMSKATLKDMAVQVASLAVPRASQQIALANTSAGLFLQLPNSRENEKEADKIGLELSARAGFNPEAAITFWEKMAAAEKGLGKPEFLSTHPSTGTRITELKAMVPIVMPLYKSTKAN